MKYIALVTHKSYIAYIFNYTNKYTYLIINKGLSLNILQKLFDNIKTE